MPRENRRSVQGLFGGPPPPAAAAASPAPTLSSGGGTSPASAPNSFTSSALKAALSRGDKRGSVGGSTKRVCAVCGEICLEEEAKRAGGAFFHANCFRCKECKQLVTGAEKPLAAATTGGGMKQLLQKAADSLLPKGTEYGPEDFVSVESRPVHVRCHPAMASFALRTSADSTTATTSNNQRSSTSAASAAAPALPDLALPASASSQNRKSRKVSRRSAQTGLNAQSEGLSRGQPTLPDLPVPSKPRSATTVDKPLSPLGVSTPASVIVDVEVPELGRSSKVRVDYGSTVASLQEAVLNKFENWPSARVRKYYTLARSEAMPNKPASSPDSTAQAKKRSVLSRDTFRRSDRDLYNSQVASDSEFSDGKEWRALRPGDPVTEAMSISLLWLKPRPCSVPAMVKVLKGSLDGNYKARKPAQLVANGGKLEFHDISEDPPSQKTLRVVLPLKGLDIALLTHEQAGPKACSSESDCVLQLAAPGALTLQLTISSKADLRDITDSMRSSGVTCAATLDAYAGFEDDRKHRDTVAARRRKKRTTALKDLHAVMRNEPVRAEGSAVVPKDLDSALETLRAVGASLETESTLLSASGGYSVGTLKRSRSRANMSFHLAQSEDTATDSPRSVDMGTIRAFHQRRRGDKSSLDLEDLRARTPTPTPQVDAAAEVVSFVEGLATQKDPGYVHQFLRKFLPHQRSSLESASLVSETLVLLGKTVDALDRNVLQAAAQAANHGLPVDVVLDLLSHLTYGPWRDELNPIFLSSSARGSFLNTLLVGSEDRADDDIVSTSTALKSRTMRRNAFAEAQAHAWKRQDDQLSAVLKSSVEKMPADTLKSFLGMRSKTGEQALHLACSFGLEQFVRMLVGYGIMINTIGRDGRRALAYALVPQAADMKPSLTLCAILLKANAVIDDAVRSLSNASKDLRISSLIRDVDRDRQQRHAARASGLGATKTLSALHILTLGTVSRRSEKASSFDMEDRMPRKFGTVSRSSNLSRSATFGDLGDMLDGSGDLLSSMKRDIAALRAPQPWDDVLGAIVPTERLHKVQAHKVDAAKYSKEQVEQSNTILLAMKRQKPEAIPSLATSAPEAPSAPPPPVHIEKRSSVASAADVDFAELFGTDCKAPGSFQVWMIDGKFPEALELEEYGTFFTRDCYIVLDYNEAAPEIHVWHGDQASVDKKAISAVRAVELNRFLGDVATIHRHDAKDEPERFVDMFEEPQPFQIRQGGSENSFRNYSNTPIVADGMPQAFATPRLYCVQSAQAAAMRVWQTEADASALTDADAFVLDCGNKVFVWRVEGGTHTGGVASYPALQLAQRLNQHERHGRATVVDLVQRQDETTEDFADFWLSLDTTQPDGLAAVVKGRSEFDPQVRIVTVSHQGTEPKLESTDLGGDVVLGSDSGSYGLKRALLQSDKCFIADFFWEVYVWLGASAPRKTKEFARKLALALVASDDSRDAWVAESSPRVELGGHESPLFRAKFDDWSQVNGGPEDVDDAQVKAIQQSLEARAVGRTSVQDELLRRLAPSKTSEERAVSSENLAAIVASCLLQPATPESSLPAYSAPPGSTTEVFVLEKLVGPSFAKIDRTENFDEFGVFSASSAYTVLQRYENYSSDGGCDYIAYFWEPAENVSSTSAIPSNKFRNLYSSWVLGFVPTLKRTIDKAERGLGQLSELRRVKMFAEPLSFCEQFDGLLWYEREARFDSNSFSRRKLAPCRLAEVRVDDRAIIARNGCSFPVVRVLPSDPRLCVFSDDASYLVCWEDDQGVARASLWHGAAVNDAQRLGAISAFERCPEVFSQQMFSASTQSSVKIDVVTSLPAALEAIRRSSPLPLVGQLSTSESALPPLLIEVRSGVTGFVAEIVSQGESAARNSPRRLPASRFYMTQDDLFSKPGSVLLLDTATQLFVFAGPSSSHELKDASKSFVKQFVQARSEALRLPPQAVVDISSSTSKDAAVRQARLSFFRHFAFWTDVDKLEDERLFAAERKTRVRQAAEQQRDRALMSRQVFLTSQEEFYAQCSQFARRPSQVEPSQEEVPVVVEVDTQHFLPLGYEPSVVPYFSVEGLESTYDLDMSRVGPTQSRPTWAEELFFEHLQQKQFESMGKDDLVAMQHAQEVQQQAELEEWLSQIPWVLPVNDARPARDLPYFWRTIFDEYGAVEVLAGHAPGAFLMYPAGDWVGFVSISGDGNLSTLLLIPSDDGQAWLLNGSPKHRYQTIPALVREYVIAGWLTAALLPPIEVEDQPLVVEPHVGVETSAEPSPDSNALPTHNDSPPFPLHLCVVHRHRVATTFRNELPCCISCLDLPQSEFDFVSRRDALESCQNKILSDLRELVLRVTRLTHPRSGEAAQAELVSQPRRIVTSFVGAVSTCPGPCGGYKLGLFACGTDSHVAKCYSCALLDPAPLSRDETTPLARVDAAASVAPELRDSLETRQEAILSNLQDLFSRTQSLARTISPVLDKKVRSSQPRPRPRHPEKKVSTLGSVPLKPAPPKKIIATSEPAEMGYQPLANSGSPSEDESTSLLDDDTHAFSPVLVKSPVRRAAPDSALRRRASQAPEVEIGELSAQSSGFRASSAQILGFDLPDALVPNSFSSISGSAASAAEAPFDDEVDFAALRASARAERSSRAADQPLPRKKSADGIRHFATMPRLSFKSVSKSVVSVSQPESSSPLVAGDELAVADEDDFASLRAAARAERESARGSGASEEPRQRGARNFASMPRVSYKAVAAQRASRQNIDADTSGLESEVSGAEATSRLISELALALENSEEATAAENSQEAAVVEDEDDFASLRAAARAERAASQSTPGTDKAPQVRRFASMTRVSYKDIQAQREASKASAEQAVAEKDAPEENSGGDADELDFASLRASAHAERAAAEQDASEASSSGDADEVDFAALRASARAERVAAAPESSTSTSAAKNSGTRRFASMPRISYKAVSSARQQEANDDNSKAPVLSDSSASSQTDSATTEKDASGSDDEVDFASLRASARAERGAAPVRQSPESDDGDGEVDFAALRASARAEREAAASVDKGTSEAAPPRSGTRRFASLPRISYKDVVPTTAAATESSVEPEQPAAQSGGRRFASLPRLNYKEVAASRATAASVFADGPAVVEPSPAAIASAVAESSPGVAAAAVSSEPVAPVAEPSVSSSSSTFSSPAVESATAAGDGDNPTSDVSAKTLKNRKKRAAKKAKGKAKQPSKP